jgi:hypothetical protein
MAGSTIYNSTDGPLLIDRAGRVLGARERLEDVDVDSSPVAGHIKAGRLVVVDTSPADDDSDVADDPQPEAPEAAPTKPRNRRGTTSTQEG